MIKASTKILSMILVVVMLFGVFPTSAFASIDDPLSGVAGNGWDDFGGEPVSGSEAGNPILDSGNGFDGTTPDYPSDFGSGSIDGEDFDNIGDSPDSPASSATPGTTTDNAIPLGASGDPGGEFPWATNFREWAIIQSRMRSGSVSTTPINWADGQSNAIWLGGTTETTGYYISSPMYKVSFDGKTAFCAEFNGMQAGGNYDDGSAGGSSAIKQILANYDASAKSNGDYVAAQAAIWAILTGKPVVSWGVSPGGSSASAILNGTNDYSKISYKVHTNVDTPHTQNIITYTNEPGDIPPTPGEEGWIIETETKQHTETEVHNRKTYEYSDAIGQITIRKHDQDGKSLDGALFNIDVAFTDGSHVRVNNWEVDNGARLFTWTHPQDNHDPATVTVTEVVPPRYYEGDPTPKMAVVYPTYTRVTHVETWTVTVTVETTTTTVTNIETGEVTISEGATATDTAISEPQVEEFADFIEGDRETTVTFVNQRITGDIIVTKKDANTGQPLAGASVHLWGTDLGEPADIDKTLVTGADGTAVFDNLPPGTYSFQETQPPFAYNLNNELQTAVLQSGQVLQKEIRNYRKDGLVIKKVDQDGKPLAGAVFELRRGSGEVLLREVTNENGIIYRDYLVDDTYVIEEISAPEGYLLDENPIQSIRIYSTDDNKQYTLSFVNKKKPSIEITKVDGDTPTLKLEGAVFRITDSRTNQYWDIKTGADGTALLENLDINTTYIVEELEAPQGYVNSGYRQEIVLKECRKHTITVSNHHMPKMTIVKKDKGSGELLPGATFRISWNGGANYCDVTTDEKGEAVITDLTPGWYTVTETKAPAGYLLDSTPQQVLIAQGQDKVIELFNEAKPSLKIIKVDSVTKTPLQFAEFSIYKKDDSGERYIGKYISDINGEIYLEDIEPGRYAIREIKAPDGFNIDTESHEITIASGQKYELEFMNTPKSPMYIQKVDDKGNPLMGAKFKVTTMNGAMVGTVTTGRTGYAIIPYAEPGWYVVDEIQAPDGYILSQAPVNIEVKSGKPAQVEFVNHKKPQLSILKLDASDNNALIGARIKVAKANGEIIGTFTSDHSGLITLTDLEAGSYTVTEIAAPDGYILDMTPQIVELKAGESKQIELYNTGKPGLQLKKIDKLTNLPVANAVFSLVRLESGAKRDLGTYTTGTNGLFYVPDLSPGNYVLTEIKAPDGYILDSTPQNIYIEGGKLNTVEVFNVPHSTLRILKISADDNRKPLEGAIFKLFDEKRLEIGTYQTSALGEILIPQLPAGIYYVQETKAPAGYILDSTVQKVELIGGKTTVIEVKNKELGSLRILKRSKEDGKPLYNATFLLYDSKNNLLGEFSTDQNGLIVFGKNLSAGTYKLKEIKAPDGFVLDETVRTITVKEGETTEVVIDNIPMRGRIQITKKASDYNDITKDKKGALLGDAVFEIFDSHNKVVDRIETDRRGVATSKPLPLGTYGIREITAPKHYLLNDKVFCAEIKLHNDLILFEVLDEPADISVTVQKYGNYEAIPGQNIRYDFKDIANTSTVELDDFYFHDAIPTDAVRLVSISTGTYNERLTYKALYKTNQRDYRVLEDKLSTKTVNEIDCRRETLKLKNGEYITDIKFEFGTAQPGFKEVTQPFIICTVNGDLPNEYRFTNRCDAGGRSPSGSQREDEWAIAKDAWVTIIYTNPNKGPLPKTGF